MTCWLSTLKNFKQTIQAEESQANYSSKAHTKVEKQNFEEEHLNIIK